MILFDMKLGQMLFKHRKVTVSMIVSYRYFMVLRAATAVIKYQFNTCFIQKVFNYTSSLIFTDGCKKTGVVFESVVSCVEFLNCQSVQGQVCDKKMI